VARVFLHEFDHLDGVLMHDRFDADSLEEARGQLVDLEETFIKANPGVAVQRIAPAAEPAVLH
jgi:peptide deformylase